MLIIYSNDGSVWMFTPTQIHKFDANKKLNSKMKLIRLTPDNVRYYINSEIIFKTRGKHIVKIY